MRNRLVADMPVPWGAQERGTPGVGAWDLPFYTPAPAPICPSWGLTASSCPELSAWPGGANNAGSHLPSPSIHPSSSQDTVSATYTKLTILVGPRASAAYRTKSGAHSQGAHSRNAYLGYMLEEHTLGVHAIVMHIRGARCGSALWGFKLPRPG